LRYFIALSYLGTPYYGWQRQPEHISVQETVEKALSTIMRIPIAITGAGRTDTGVHALQMWAHFDIENAFAKAELEKLVHQLNSYFDHSIAIQEIVPVIDTAHARFDATQRSYIYKISTVKNPFIYGSTYHFKPKLNIQAMNEAAVILKSHTDFKCFSKVKTEVKTYLCTIQEARWEVSGDQLHFHITADRFLRNMVRAIVGTLLEIGLEKRPPSWIHGVIQSKKRSNAGTSVPAQGLYLTKVLYPHNIFTINE